MDNQFKRLQRQSELEFQQILNEGIIDTVKSVGKSIVNGTKNLAGTIIAKYNESKMKSEVVKLIYSKDFISRYMKENKKLEGDSLFELNEDIIKYAITEVIMYKLKRKYDEAQMYTEDWIKSNVKDFKKFVKNCISK